MYMLDTDTASYLIRGASAHLDRRVASVAEDELCISVITRAELLLGVRLKSEAHRLAKLVDMFLSRVPSAPWDDSAADHFATIAAQLSSRGTPIGTMDTMIAGHAIALGATLVTNNRRHFSRVAYLHTENWVLG